MRSQFFLLAQKASPQNLMLDEPGSAIPARPADQIDVVTWAMEASGRPNTNL